MSEPLSSTGTGSATDAGGDRRPEPKFPYSQATILILCLLFNAMAITSVFPMLVFMMLDYKMVDKAADAGYYAGFVASALFAGRMLGSYPLGKLSDTWGRKPILVVGLVVLGSTSIAIGFTHNFYVTVVCRFFSGLLNGIISTSKALLNDITETDDHKAKAMSGIGMAWGVGLLLGTGGGGLLTMPAESWPAMFEGTVFDEYPFLLPLGLLGVANLVLIPFVIWGLPETSHAVTGKKKPGAVTVSTTTSNGGSVGEGDEQEMGLLTSVDGGEGSVPTSNGVQSGSGSGGDASTDKHANRATTNGSATRVRDEESAEEELKPLTVKELLRMSPANSYLFFYVLLSGVVVIFGEVFPLWAALPVEDGGLGFKASQIGAALAASGAFIVCFNVVLYPKLSAKYGPENLFAYSNIAITPLNGMFPLIALAVGSAPVVWVCLLGGLMARSACELAAFTSSFLLINQSVPAHQVATAQGFATMAAAMIRFTVPLVASPLFAWSVRAGVLYLDFEIAALCTLLIGVFALRTSRRRERGWASVTILREESESGSRSESGFQLEVDEECGVDSSEVGEDSSDDHLL